MNQMTTRRWTFEEDVLGYRRASLSSAAIWYQKLAIYGEEKGLELLREHPLAVTSLYYGGGFLDPDELRWGDPTRDAIEALMLAARLGAREFVIVSGARGTFTRGHAKRLLVETLRRLGEVAANLSIGIALAPLHRGQSRGQSFLTGVAETLEVIDACRHHRVGLALDLLSSWDDPVFLTRVADMIPWLRVVSISDTASRRRGSGHQCVPGQGMVPLADRLRALCAAGYTGSIECRVLAADRPATEYPQLLTDCQIAFEQLCEAVNG